MTPSRERLPDAALRLRQVRLVMGLAPGVRIEWGPGPPRADLAERVIHLPPPEETSERARALLRCWVDHEVAHLLETAPGAMEGLDAAHRFLLNAIEDGRVNMWMSKLYPGSAINLREGNDVALEELRGKDLTSYQRATLALVSIAQGEGLDRARESLALDERALALLALVADVLERLARLRSTAEARAAALEVHTRWVLDARAAAPEGADDDWGEREVERQLVGEDDLDLGLVLARAVEDARPEASSGMPLDHLRAFERALRGMCSESARGACEEVVPPYSADTSRDVIEHVSRAPHPATVELTEANRAAVRPLVRRLLLELAGRGPVWTPHRRRGRLDGRRLARVALDDDRVFRARSVTPRVDAAVTLLVDFSGSMCGPKIRLAVELGLAFAEACEVAGVPCEVLGFTTLGGPEGVSGTERNPPPELFGRVVRWAALRHLVVKQHDEPLAGARHAFARALELVELRENIDGEALRWAAHRLLARAESRRLLLVLSDGAPAGASLFPGHRDALARDLHAAVQSVESRGITCIGLGVLSSSVKDYYPRHLVVTSLQDLVGSGLAVLGEFLRRR